MGGRCAVTEGRWQAGIRKCMKQLGFNITWYGLCAYGWQGIIIYNLEGANTESETWKQPHVIRARALPTPTARGC